MSANQYQLAIERSNIVSKTDIRGVITFVNDEFCRISKYTKEELIGQNHNIVRHPDVPKESFETLWKTILAKKTYKSTVKNMAKDGSVFYVNTTVTPILDSNGDIEEFVAIRYDVTDSILLTEALKIKEEELRELNLTLEERVEQQTKQLIDLNKNLERKINEEVEKNRKKDLILFEQSKLAAMGEMVGNIAHQWRQPLSEMGILLYSIKKSFLSKDSDNFLDYYNQGKILLQNMSETIDDFRFFFSPNKPKEYFAIESVINGVISVMKNSFNRHNIDVKVTSEDNILLFGYPNELSQVMSNLLNNSKDAFMSSFRQPFVINIHICMFDGETIGLTIRDNAGGVPVDVIDKIFEPYFTTKHALAGTGVGLYMSKMIIENNMKGSIIVFNTDEGACFEIKLPIKQ